MSTWWAYVNGHLSRPVPGLHGMCVSCGREVIPVGDMWKHVTGPASCWKQSWRERFPEQMQRKKVGNCIADVVLPDGWVIALQDASTGAPVRKREFNFRGLMVWVFEATDAVDDERLTLTRTAADSRHRTYVWHKPRTTTRWCSCPVYLDLGRGWVLAVRTLTRDERAPRGKPRAFRGDGVLLSVDEFVSRALNGLSGDPL